MDTFEIGTRFPNYKALTEALDSFSFQNKCKFWKRDARTINSSRAIGVVKYLHPDLQYYELKFTCIYGGKDFKSQSERFRTREESLKKIGCPVYLRFKASPDGQSLQLIAMNLKHNHELVLPKRTLRKQELMLSAKKRTRQAQQLAKEKCLEELVKDENIEDTMDCSDLQEFEIQLTSNVDVHSPSPCLENKGFSFRGLIAPVFTPYNANANINLDVIPQYSKYLSDRGITGVLVNGTSGEGMALTVAERKIVAEAWQKHFSKKNQHVMVQVGGACLPDVLDMAQHAEKIGVDSLLCLPELYFKPTTCDELIEYLKIIGEAAPNTPLLYYHIPSFTNVNINMGAFLNKIADQVPTFSGIKFTSTTLDEGVTAVKAHNQKFAVFLGADTIMAGAYALGFDSAIATSLNIYPEHGRNILNLMKDGKVGESKSVQEELNSAIAVITNNGSWVSTMKAAMNLYAPFNLGTTRRPLIALNASQIKEMETELKELNLIEN